MLVVEGVALQFLEQISGVHRFDAEHSPGGQGNPGPLEDQARLGIMSKDVAAGNDIRWAELASYLFRKRGTKGAREDIPAIVACHRGNVGRQLDAHRPDS